MFACASAGQADSTGLLEGLDHGADGALRRHWEAALMDADSAVGMDPAYAKAYLRRAQALMRLQRAGEALSAAEEGRRWAADSSGSSGLGRELQALVEELEAMCAGAPSLGPVGAADGCSGKESSARVGAVAKPAGGIVEDIRSGLLAGAATSEPDLQGPSCSGGIEHAAEHSLDLDEMD